MEKPHSISKALIQRIIGFIASGIDLSINIILVRKKNSLNRGKTKQDIMGCIVDEIPNPKLRFTSMVLEYKLCHTSRENYVPNNIENEVV